MDGLAQAAAAIRNRWPAIKIAATSGLRNIGKEDLPLGRHFLLEPCRSDRRLASRIDRRGLNLTRRNLTPFEVLSWRVLGASHGEQ